MKKSLIDTTELEYRKDGLMEEQKDIMKDEKLQEKLNQLLEIAKKHKNVLEDNEIIACFAGSKDFELTTEMMENIFDFLESNKVEVL